MIVLFISFCLIPIIVFLKLLTKSSAVSPTISSNTVEFVPCDIVEDNVSSVSDIVSIDEEGHEIVDIPIRQNFTEIEDIPSDDIDVIKGVELKCVQTLIDLGIEQEMHDQEQFQIYCSVLEEVTG